MDGLTLWCRCGSVVDMRRLLTAACLVVLCAPGCIPIMMHGAMQAEAAQKVEWERQNFEREKLGMPLLTFEEWKARTKPKKPTEPSATGTADQG